MRDETLQKRKITSAATIQNIKFFMVEFKSRLRFEKISSVSIGTN